MANLLNIPENVMIQLLFPFLDHNDLLRLRRVSKQTKAFADAYLWTCQPGHQGKWELEIDNSKNDQSLQTFLQLGLPPPSRLHIVNEADKGPSEQRSFFEDEQLEIFMERYSKYLTKLILDKLFFPFTSSKELGFYESLVNLEELCCTSMITVGGSTQFEEKTRNAQGSFLVRPSFKKLKTFKLDKTDCLESMWNFINGVSNNLVELLHPFQRSDNLRLILTPTNFRPVQQLIERRGMKMKTQLLYDWNNLLAEQAPERNPLELLQVFASCRDNGVMIKNLSAGYLDCLLFDENVIHSLVGLTDTVFMMQMAALESIKVAINEHFYAHRWRGSGYPQWPNLKKMCVELGDNARRHIPLILRDIKRPKLEELSLACGTKWDVGLLDLGNCCGNLKKLTVNCCGDSSFFLALWDGLPLLEDVTFLDCPSLTNKGFIGNPVDGSGPEFLKLKKLKHLSIHNLEKTLRLTDTVFTKVFRHLKLSSFKLTSDKAVKSITIEGIKKLLTGPFAETIEKLDLDQLQLENVSGEELKEVVSRFRSSKML